MLEGYQLRLRTLLPRHTLTEEHSIDVIRDINATHV